MTSLLCDAPLCHADPARREESNRIASVWRDVRDDFTKGLRNRPELNSLGKYHKTIRRHTARHSFLAHFHSIHLAEHRPNRIHSDSSNWQAVPFVVETS
jgi:hypothetical protein